MATPGGDPELELQRVMAAVAEALKLPVAGASESPAAPARDSSPLAPPPDESSVKIA